MVEELAVQQVVLLILDTDALKLLDCLQFVQQNVEMEFLMLERLAIMVEVSDAHQAVR